MVDLDFLIPQEYQGKILSCKRVPFTIKFPQGAVYVDVNPLEDENEFQGCLDQSDRQELHFYDDNKRYLSSLPLDGVIATCGLMSALEEVLVKQYQ